MLIQSENLERLYKDFVRFLKTKNEDFQNFHSSSFIDRDENYKYEVFELAKKSLEQHLWKQTDIGTGKIQNKVTEAIKAHVGKHNNNLVDWRKKDDFSKLPVSKNLEEILYNFFKNKTTDSEVFGDFLKLGLSYQLIAYLYFIKDKNRYLPITQERFDEIFILIGIPEFKSAGRASWQNYSAYIDIVKQVKDFLKTKDPKVTLLDAHSFLYILGSQMKEESFSFTLPNDINIYELSTNGGQVINGVKEESSATNEIAAEDNTFFNDEKLPEELPEQITQQLFEGAKKTIIVNAYERNAKARQLCIDHWKAICAVCNFNFEQMYGDIGKGFIHVHHLTPVYKIGQAYEIDPINDLRPVCPNCHAILHREEETMTIEKLKLIVAANEKKIVNL